MCHMCLPDNSECEWEKLKPFVDMLNKATIRDYRLVECLDAFKRDRPHPEILLMDNETGHQIVVEHKIVVWPPEHLQKHRSHHDFMNRIGDALNAEFRDDVYVLEAATKSVERSKKEIREISDSIVRTVIENKGQIMADGFIRSDAPIPWSIRKLNDFEKDEDDVPEAGVGVVLSGPLTSFTDQDPSVAEGGVKQILTDHLNKTSRKFEGYDEQTRIFVTEAYSNDGAVDHRLIEALVGELDMPENIDEIWVGYPEWISENDHVPMYRRIR